MVRRNEHISYVNDMDEGVIQKEGSQGIAWVRPGATRGSYRNCGRGLTAPDSDKRKIGVGGAVRKRQGKAIKMCLLPMNPPWETGCARFPRTATFLSREPGGFQLSP